MAVKSYPWGGVAPGDGPDAGRYTDSEWWAVWAAMARAGGLIVPAAASPLRTAAAFTNVGVFYSIGNQLEVTDGGGLIVQVDTGAALIDGQFDYESVAKNLTLPASKTSWYVVLRKNFTALEYTPTGWVAGEGKVPANSTRLTWVSALTQSTDRSTYWDIPLATFSTDAVDITALADAREFVDAGTIKTFTPALYGYQSAAPGTALITDPTFGGMNMIDNIDTVVHSHFIIPSNFISDLVATAVVVPGGTGNMRANFSANYGACSEAHAIHSDSLAAAQYAVALSTYNCIAPITFTSPTAGDFVRMLCQRDGNNVLDTVNADIAFLGWQLEYFGWKMLV